MRNRLLFAFVAVGFLGSCRAPDPPPNSTAARLARLDELRGPVQVSSDGIISVPAPTAEQTALLRDIVEPPELRQTDRPVRKLRGRVVNAQGEPIAGVRIRTQRAYPGITKYHWEEAVTDASGEFTLACGLPASGSIQLNITDSPLHPVDRTLAYALDEAHPEEHLGVLALEIQLGDPPGSSVRDVPGGKSPPVPGPGSPGG